VEQKKRDYKEVDKRVKTSAKEDKKKYLDEQAETAEKTAGRGDLKTHITSRRSYVGRCQHVTHITRIETTLHELDIDTSNITRDEIRKAIRKLKNNKAGGSDNIQAEMIKESEIISVEMLHALINKIWDEEYQGSGRKAS
jgi:hypothetical protein